MPCDGVTVAYLNVAAAEELLETPEAVQAVATLLLNTKVVGQNTLEVQGHRVEITRYGVRGYRVPRAVLDAVQKACTEVAGVLTQEKVAAEIARNAQVAEKRYAANGYLVMKVNL